MSQSTEASQLMSALTHQASHMAAATRPDHATGTAAAGGTTSGAGQAPIAGIGSAGADMTRRTGTKR